MKEHTLRLLDLEDPENGKITSRQLGSELKVWFCGRQVWVRWVGVTCLAVWVNWV
ncbi:hypothetical protein M378DRAFT_171175 [Amanita muscaria Koide BX008]|uniref:Uncharacterized protein n=1 Tax=Amanita muscaria (strain Koide BX008) TaxID=946122 RepID=A0A0C2WNZ7_AMAMK|nr:hypothetical protein M378DRAFT_171175 [Amanita muscaria Koide BX008]